MAQEIADSTLLDTWASSGLIVEPDISKIIEGWQLGEQPPHEYMNWLQNTFGSKLNHILKNGVASWNNITPYLAGSSVQHNGNVWLCKATNTNSAPTDANANWKRIITVESLTTVLGGYVKNSGDETIAGVKTFSSSPIVPTPTVGTQAVNKDYADLKVALAQFTGSNQSLLRNGYQKLPGGLIIQWGETTTDGGGVATATFPIAYTTQFLSGSSTLSRANFYTSAVGVSMGENTLTTLTFRIRDVSGVGVSGEAIRYIAIGY